MNKYEIAVVLNAQIEDEQRAEVIENINSLISRFGGVPIDVDDWGKKRLAYEIAKMKEGYYYFIHFEGDVNVPAEMEARLRIMDNVMRYLVVSMDEA